MGVGVCITQGGSPIPSTLLKASPTLLLLEVARLLLDSCKLTRSKHYENNYLSSPVNKIISIHIFVLVLIIAERFCLYTHIILSLIEAVWIRVKM